MRSITNALAALGESLLWNRLHRSKYLPGLLLCLIGMSLTVIAAPSNLDPTFGSSGKVVSSPDGSEMLSGSSMALQPDGKIVMVGYRATGPGQASNFIVARYNANGSLDTTFGNNGWSSPTFGATGEYAWSVDIQPDGKIVVGGAIQNVVMGVPLRELALVRLNSDGSIDTTFDGDGKVTIDFNNMLVGFYGEFPNALKVASDGKIIVGGYAINGGVDSYFILARLNANGSLDTTFGTNGKLVPARHGVYNFLSDLVVLSDGKIVVAGYTSGPKFSSRVVEKYNLNGSVDWTYINTLQGIGLTQALNGIALQPDGKFVVVGHHLNNIIAVRVNVDGTADNTFINPAMPKGEAISVAIQADGKIVANIVNTNTFYPLIPGFSLVRCNANGSLDTAFGNGGIIHTSVTNGQDFGKKVLIQPDGKILVGGSSQLSSPTRYYFTMVRYMGAFPFPSHPLFDYDNDGRADVSVFRPSENKWFVLRSTDSGVTQPYFAIAGDIPVPADYDGDGRTDFAVFRPAMGDWWYLSSINNSQIVTHWGQAGDVPRPSDFDGDGRSDFVLFRPSTNYWYRNSSSSGGSSISEFGLTGDKPLSGDFDGDGKSDLAIFRPSTGVFWYMSSIDSVHRAIAWGASTDIPVPADYDGDGKTDAAVYRPSTGFWYIYYSGNGSSSFTNFGIAEDRPVPADYDGDRKADIAVYRPSNGTWYMQQTTAGFGAMQWGVGTDTPTENAFIP